MIKFDQTNYGDDKENVEEKRGKKKKKIYLDGGEERGIDAQMMGLQSVRIKDRAFLMVLSVYIKMVRE